MKREETGSNADAPSILDGEQARESTLSDERVAELARFLVAALLREQRLAERELEEYRAGGGRTH